MLAVPDVEVPDVIGFTRTIGCVPIALDVDCVGDTGDGPAYVDGPVYVRGSDLYGLDGNDNDGVGCES